jgi:hypothetical protein
MNPRNRIVAVLIMLFALALAAIDFTLAYRFHKKVLQVRELERKLDRQLEDADRQIREMNEKLDRAHQQLSQRTKPGSAAVAGNNNSVTIGGTATWSPPPTESGLSNPKGGTK